MTAAGTIISNQATVRVAGAGASDSNVVRTIVAERLDVALALRDAATSVSQQATVPVLLTNAGNGTEQFDLVARVDDDASHTVRFVIDRDGDGHVGEADELLADARTPALQPGAQLALIAIVENVAADRTITVAAAAVTGSGTPGTLLANKGDGGGDAVVGPTGARAEVSVSPAPATGAATLTKSQSVRDRRGGSVAEPGATITYTLVAHFDAAATGATIADPIPAGTTLVANSITLDGAALTDTADGDAGAADGSSVRVALGAVPAAATRTVTFQVVIQ